MKIVTARNVIAAIAASVLAYGFSTAGAQGASNPYTNCSGGNPPDQVIAACSAVISSGNQTAENLARALNNRGVAYGRLRDFAHAMADFSQAINTDPEYSEAFRNRGGVFAQRGDDERALADLNQALRLNPRNVKAFQNRALVYQFQGHYQLAIADFDHAIEIDPHDTEVLNGACWARVLFGRELDHALQNCNAALAIHSQNANALNSRAAVEFLSGDFQRAVADYDTSYQLAPNMIGSLYGRGVSKLHLGQTTSGQSDVTEAMSHDSNVVTRYAAIGVRP